MKYLNNYTYCIPILKALKELGGEANLNIVLDHVYKQVQDQLTFDDTSNITSGEIAWKNRARWMRAVLVKKGLVGGPSRGIWSITDKGKRYLKKDEKMS